MNVLFLFLIPLLAAAADGGRRTYIVYMGAIPNNSNASSLEQTHLQLLSSVLKRGLQAEKTIKRRYEHSFSGFSARLSEGEAQAISKKPGVVSVFADTMYQLHTTRSWDFLQNTLLETDSSRVSGGGPADTIIGLLDTGVWPESKSFDDTGMRAIPSRWKGTCVTRPDFNASNCNKKLIGARYYNTDDDDNDAFTSIVINGSPRDESGHGTHTSSTAAGAAVTDASYYGLAAGTAKGGSPSSRVAMYKVCDSSGCPGSALLSGFDDAVADGVDLLSVSIGAFMPGFHEFKTDPIAIGAFHAVAKGILVVCSAGNSGPDAGTVVNAAPWILTVAATSIDRIFESDVLLGGNHKAIKGEAINFSNLSKTAVYPLITGASAKSNSSSIDDATHCEILSLDESKVKGKIVLCKDSPGDLSKTIKARFLPDTGAVGAIMAVDLEQAKTDYYVSFPVTEISAKAANEVYAYINSTKDPVATILPSITIEKVKPAPAVASFSSKGPCAATSNILKPDIAAPGVNILASWIPTNDTSIVPFGHKPSGFKIEGGTSMACPHVAGVAATVKSWNPSWTPSAIRSAIMTTATQANNDGGLITMDTGSKATPYDYGAGQVNPTGALQPGLVYELGNDDYLQFLCNYGYQASDIKLITKISDEFQCPKNSSTDLISNLNYPSIAIKLNGTESKTVSKTATNVGTETAVSYLVTVKSPPELEVKVTPEKLQFSKNDKKVTYQVTFSASSSSPKKGDHFGSIIWSDGTHKVKSPFAVTVT